MNQTKTESTAQIYDRLISRTTLALFILSIAIGIDCTRYFVEGDLDEVLRWIRKGLSIGIVVLVAPSMFKMLRLRFFSSGDCREPESFLLSIYQKACVYAFASVMISILLLQAFVQTALVSLPTEFYLKLVFGVAMLAVSISFFAQIRAENEDDDFDDEVVE